MAKKLIGDRVFRLKHAETVKLPEISQELVFSNGEEFHIVAGVLYMKGFPVPGAMQRPIIEWVLNNPSKFVNDNRNF
jgi:hypothetical protein